MAEKPGLLLFLRPRGIQPLSPRATKGLNSHDYKKAAPNGNSLFFS